MKPALAVFLRCALGVTLPAWGQADAATVIGNASKNILEGPGEKTGDLFFGKFFNFTEQVNMKFRGELFSVLNHPVFSQPTLTLQMGQALRA